MRQRLQGLVAIITGGGRGIGEATARLFAEHGAKTLLVSRTYQQVHDVAAQINALHGDGQALAFSADISREDEVEKLFETCDEAYGGLDILVNNAGAISIKPLVEMSVEEWDRQMAVNLRGPFLCSRAAMRRMIERGKGGCIIHVGSLSGIRGVEKFPGMSAYVASKSGVTGLTEAMSAEGKPHGIRVNCIAPGAVDTQMLREAAPHLSTETVPADVAQNILFLADPIQSAKLSGAILEIHSNA